MSAHLAKYPPLLRRRPARWLGVLCLAGMIAGSMVPARAQTLAEALAAAYRNNPELQAQRAHLRATDERVPEALSGWRPRVRINGQAGDQDLDTTLSADLAGPGGGEISKRLHTRTANLQVEQPLYSGGRTTAATRQAENAVRAGRAQLAAAEQVVLLQAATAYLDVVRNRAVLSLSENNVAVLEEQLRATRDRKEVGVLTNTDVYQAEARVARAQAARQAATAALASARAQYQRVTGESAGELSAPTAVDGLPASEAEAVALAVARNPETVAAGFEQAAARDAVRRARGERLPSLSLTGQLGYERDSSLFIDRNDASSVMLNLSVPIYQAGVVGARVRQAMEAVTQAEAQAQATRQKITASATAAWQDLEAAVAEIDAYRQQVRAAKAALNGVKQEAEVGTRTVLDVLNAQQELLNARVDLTSAERDRLVAAFRLKAVIGKLTAKSLGLAVEHYDPETHYRETRDRW